MIRPRTIMVILYALTATPVIAQTSVESAVVRFSGQDRGDDLFAIAATTSQELFGEPGQGNITQFSTSGTLIKSSKPNAYGTGQDVTLERRGSVGVSQTFNKLTSAGASYGYTTTNRVSRWYALRVGQWWNKATISTDLELMKTDSNRPSRDYLDTDGARILVPGHATGDRYTLSLTWLATTRAMLLGSLSTMTASDRPSARAGTLEGRYFFDQTLTAIHLKAGIYDDSDQVKKTTDYGRVSARDWEAQAHQHLSDKLIASLIFRDHFEAEAPRSEDTPDIHRHTRSTQARLRWRFVTGPVTDSVSEIYLFSGQYQSMSEKQTISHLGLGGVYVL